MVSVSTPRNECSRFKQPMPWVFISLRNWVPSCHPPITNLCDVCWAKSITVPKANSSGPGANDHCKHIGTRKPLNASDLENERKAAVSTVASSALNVYIAEETGHIHVIGITVQTLKVFGKWCINTNSGGFCLLIIYCCCACNRFLAFDCDIMFPACQLKNCMTTS